MDNQVKTTCRKCGVKASAFGSEFLGKYVCANCQPKHEHIFQRRKPSSKVETCVCGKFRRTENAGPSIVAVEAKATPTKPARLAVAEHFKKVKRDNVALLEACRSAYNFAKTYQANSGDDSLETQEHLDNLFKAIANAEGR